MICAECSGDRYTGFLRLLNTSRVLVISFEYGGKKADQNKQEESYAEIYSDGAYKAVEPKKCVRQESTTCSQEAFAENSHDGGSQSRAIDLERQGVFCSSAITSKRNSQIGWTGGRCARTVAKAGCGFGEC